MITGTKAHRGMNGTQEDVIETKRGVMKLSELAVSGQYPESCCLP